MRLDTQTFADVNAYQEEVRGKGPQTDLGVSAMPEYKTLPTLLASPKPVKRKSKGRVQEAKNG